MKKKVGLAPGTIIYTGEKNPSCDTPITFYKYNNSFFKKEDFQFENSLTFPVEKNCVNWINCGSIHDEKVLKKLGELFNIDSLILEDIANISQRPKLEKRDDFLFLTLKMLYFPANDNNVAYEQVSLILFSDLLITFQENSFDIFDEIISRIEKDINRIKVRHTGYLAYSLIDRIIDDYFAIIEDFEEQLEALEDIVTKNPEKKDFEEILRFKKETLTLKKVVFPLKELVYKLNGSDMKESLSEDLYIYLKDLQDHITIISENVDYIVYRGNELLQLYHSTVSTNMNKIMKVLTIISTIFIPLTFLTGFYGMNFIYIPGLSLKTGYLIFCYVAIFIVLLTIVFFKKIKWW
nr:magnesium/cobalt transporter CorA [uncultured Cetobacterium sp.]